MADYRRYGNYNYIEGNAVRQLEPVVTPDIERREPERKIDTREQEVIRKRRQQATVIDAKYTVLVACACLIVMAACVGYLKVQAAVTIQKDTIAALESEYNQLCNENVAKEEKLNSSIDLNQIYTRASKDLGMSYADSKHTILYQSSDPDYVRQYQEIPESK